MEIILSKNIKKLDQYAYPKEIINVVYKFVEIVDAVFENQESGILLVGSAARGELCWQYTNGKLVMYSDIEFLIAVEKKNKPLLNEIKKQVTTLDSNCAYGQAFHIDYTIITWQKLPKIEKKFFIFESKQCGIDLGTRSISDILPTINQTNLNWKELNEILLHRLSSMLHAIPISLFDHTTSELEQHYFALNLAKNTLDLTTWLHPYESTDLTAGFEMRIKSWNKDFLKASQFGNYFNDDDIDYIRHCLALRKNPVKKTDTTYMLGQTMMLYNKAIAYCKYMNGINEKHELSDALPSIKLFDEYRFRQIASQDISILKNLSKLGIIKGLRNMICIRKGVAASFSYYMLLAVYNKSINDPASDCYLEKASIELRRLTKILNVKADFVQKWKELRAHFKVYQDITRNY